MKYIISILAILLSFASCAQSYIYSEADSAYIYVEETTEIVGDSAALADRLFDLAQTYSLKAAYHYAQYLHFVDVARKARKEFVDHTDVNYNSYTRDRIATRFVGDYKFVSDSTYTAEMYTTNTGLLKLKIEGVDTYNVYPLDKRSFEVRNLEGTGEHIKFVVTETITRYTNNKTIVIKFFEPINPTGDYKLKYIKR